MPPIVAVGGDGADAFGDAPWAYGEALGLGFLDDGVGGASKLGSDGVEQVPWRLCFVIVEQVFDKAGDFGGDCLGKGGFDGHALGTAGNQS